MVVLLFYERHLLRIRYLNAPNWQWILHLVLVEINGQWRAVYGIVSAYVRLTGRLLVSTVW